MSFKYKLPTSTKIPSRTLRSELANIRRIVIQAMEEGSQGLLSRAYKALRDLATFPVKPRFTFKEMKRERDLNYYNDTRATIAEDMSTAREELGALLDSSAQQFNIATMQSAELEGLASKASSKAQDLAILSQEEILTAIVAGDDFNSVNLVDNTFPTGSTSAHIDIRQGIATLHRTLTENVMDPEAVEIEITKVSPIPTSGKIDTFSQLYTLYEGRFAALVGQAEPEGGQWHFEEFVDNEIKEGYSFDKDVSQWKNGNLISEVNQTSPDIHQVGGKDGAPGQGAASPIGNIVIDDTGFPIVVNEILTRDRGATEEEKKEIRKKMIDGNPDTYWQCEYAVQPPELSGNTDLRSINQDRELENDGDQSVPEDARTSITPDELRENAVALDNTDLIVSVTLTFPEPVDLNWLNLRPMNFGETTWVKVRKLETAADRNSGFELIPGFDTSTFENTLTDDVNAELLPDEAEQILSPSRFSYRGSGVWTFPSKKVQKIRFELAQEIPIPILYQRINIQMHRLIESVNDERHSGDRNLRTNTRKKKEWTKIIELAYLQTVRIYIGNTTIANIVPGTDAKSTATGNTTTITSSSLGLGEALTLGVFGSSNDHTRVSSFSKTEDDTGWYIRNFWPRTYYDRIAYRLGIREIGAYRMRYASESEIISIPFISPRDIRKVTLRVDEIIPSLDTSIKYFISPDDGKNWHQINPLDKPTIYKDDGFPVPRLINFNAPGVAPEGEKYVITEVPVRHVIFKAMMKSEYDTMSPILKRYRLIMYPSEDLRRPEVGI